MGIEISDYELWHCVKDEVETAVESKIEESITDRVDEAVRVWMYNNDLTDYLDLSELPDAGISEERAKEVFSSLFSAVIERVTKIAIGDYNNE